MSGLNAVIHQPVRLRIMAALVGLAPDEQMNFVALRDLLDATDGNLGAHLAKLEAARYVALEKTFVSRKPCTFLKATHKGRAAFEDHVAALRAILNPTSE